MLYQFAGAVCTGIVRTVRAVRAAPSVAKSCLRPEIEGFRPASRVQHMRARSMAFSMHIGNGMHMSCTMMHTC